ncbi:MAG: hypothetical protein QXP53_02330 [Candidatus Pacearchaeota archaeon]
MIFKKKKTIVPEPPGYGPEDFGFDVPASEEHAREKLEESAKRKEFGSMELEPWKSDIRSELSSLTIKKEGAIVKDVFKHSPEKPIFIRVENFKEIVETILALEKRLDDLESIISKLEEIKEKEAQELANWQQEIQDIKDQLKVLEKNFSEKL